MKALTRTTTLRASAILAALASSLCFAAVAFGLPPFTTAPKTASASGGQTELFGAATGCHATFDRFVVRGRLATPGYDVRYVSNGDRLGLRGRRLGGQRELHLVCGGECLLDVADDVQHRRKQGAGHAVPQPRERGSCPRRLGCQSGHRGVGAVVDQRGQ
jgi:hypothetical protein